MDTGRMQPDYFNYRKEWFLPKQHNRGLLENISLEIQAYTCA
jgi:hypothetical protein